MRKSPNSGTPVISLSCHEKGVYKVANFKVLTDGQGQFYLYDDTGRELKFPTLEAMLDYYKTHDPTQKGGLPHQLQQCLPFSRKILGR